MIESRSKDFIAGTRCALFLNPVDELCCLRTSRQHAGWSDQYGRAPLFPDEISRVCDFAFPLNGERENSPRCGRHVASQPSAALSSSLRNLRGGTAIAP
jgi:hypothetical protein